ncbi:hypothetical protein [Pseudoalteromonas sp. T1lg48]|uniref:hypothetical protein n=1 Tax=Pseudoalteromonas sp. T1lg48 TaxID=2077100 RepID=UPI00131A3328|nr:hypothetical protein [Pseudoalteromonas sp. T1lg48]
MKNKIIKTQHNLSWKKSLKFCSEQFLIFPVVAHTDMLSDHAIEHNDEVFGDLYSELLQEIGVTKTLTKREKLVLAVQCVVYLDKLGFVKGVYKNKGEILEDVDAIKIERFVGYELTKDGVEAIFKLNQHEETLDIQKIMKANSSKALCLSGAALVTAITIAGTNIYQVYERENRIKQNCFEKVDVNAVIKSIPNKSIQKYVFNSLEKKCYEKK